MDHIVPAKPISLDSATQTLPAGKSLLLRLLLVWLIFFLICLGLGYPTLKRYDPTRVEGMTDTIVYQQIVLGSATERPHNEVFGGRILVPYTARVFYRIFASRLQTLNPVTFSLLLAASIFCATGALLLVLIGRHVTENAGAGLLAGTLYLLSFTVPNFQLAGLVDSGEAFFMLALTCSLLFRRWWLLPVCGILGVLAKETFLPFAAIFAMVWWIVEERRSRNRVPTFGWIASMILLSVASLTTVRTILFGHLIWPWQIAAALNASMGFFASLAQCVTERSFWYVFSWLLPVGLLGIRSVPRAWRWATLITALAALFLGAFSAMGGTVARPLFSIAGPILSLAVGIFATRILSPRPGS